MTLQEAKAKLISEGYQGEPTPEALRQCGWEPSGETKAFLAIELQAPARTPDQVRDDCALVLEEAKANKMPAQFLNLLGKVAGSALKFV